MSLLKQRDKQLKKIYSAIISSSSVNMRLVTRDNLLELAKKYQDRTSQTTLDNTPYDGGASAYIDDEYPEYEYDASDVEYLMQRREAHPNVYKSSLYRQNDEPSHRGGISSLLHRNKSGGMTSGQSNLYNYNSMQNSYREPLLLKLLNNPIVLVIFVVVAAYVIAYLLGNILHIDAGFVGIIEMVVALLLSYGISLYTVRNSDFIVKGSFVFFISLIILIILIFNTQSCCADYPCIITKFCHNNSRHEFRTFNKEMSFEKTHGNIKYCCYDCTKEQGSDKSDTP